MRPWALPICNNLASTGECHWGTGSWTSLYICWDSQVHGLYDIQRLSYSRLTGGKYVRKLWITWYLPVSSSFLLFLMKTQESPHFVVARRNGNPESMLDSCMLLLSLSKQVWGEHSLFRSTKVIWYFLICPIIINIMAVCTSWVMAEGW